MADAGCVCCGKPDDEIVKETLGNAKNKFFGMAHATVCGACNQYIRKRHTKELRAAAEAKDHALFTQIHQKGVAERRKGAPPNGCYA